MGIKVPHVNLRELRSRVKSLLEMDGIKRVDDRDKTSGKINMIDANQRFLIYPYSVRDRINFTPLVRQRDKSKGL